MSLAAGLLEAYAKLRALDVEPAVVRVTRAQLEALSREVQAVFPHPEYRGVPMFDGVRLEVVACGNCGAGENLWTVNSEGGYGRPGLWACTSCLRGPWNSMVPRLLEAYPEADADELRAALERK